MHDTVMLWITGGLITALLGSGCFWLRTQQRLQRLLVEQYWLQQTVQQLQQDCQKQSDDCCRLQAEKQQLVDKISLLQAELATASESSRQQQHWHDACDSLNSELKALQALVATQRIERREVEVRLEESQHAAEQKQQLLLNSEQRLSTQFENLANRIFAQSGRQVDEQNRLSLEKLLVPLREQLEGFRRQMQESFGHEARERHTLVYEIHQLQQLNLQMAKDAVNLTQALKGNNKTQGNWGEVVLTRVLEASGLREGHEYQIQVSLTDDQLQRLRPDVVVQLPQGKAVIIDAKLSLTAYERYFNEEQAEQRQQALNEHLTSMRNHIRQLDLKDYRKLLGLGTSLDYILMFIPVEPAFLLAIDQAPELLNEALQRNIMLVSPSTLLIALRTIDNLWRYERQSKNAERIAENAAALYDKLRLFVTDMEQLGKSLAKAQESYQQAMNKLVNGRGNLIRQAEKFRPLGVAIKRPMSPSLVIQAEALEESEAPSEQSGDNVDASVHSEDGG